jgi:DEAD/DEAH box helicase domain-containing protein
VNNRLGWEIGTEFTFDARIGRTLEKSGCAIASVDKSHLNSALERISVRVSNELEELRDIPTYQFEPFLLGVLNRLKNMGAVDLPVLGPTFRFRQGLFISPKTHPWMQTSAQNTRSPHADHQTGSQTLRPASSDLEEDLVREVGLEAFLPPENGR